MQKLIIANWKCNPTTLKVVQKMALELRKRIKKNPKIEIAVCPPFVYLSEVAKMFKGSSLRLGAQNCFWEERGAFTGEVSPLMLKNLGVKYVILGHSERIMMVGETNEMINKKVQTALRDGLFPVVCIGEDATERTEGKTFQILEQEFEQSLIMSKKIDWERVVLVYEPLWAISTSSHSLGDCTADDALTAALFLRKLVLNKAGQKAARNIKILYGGNVNAQNAEDYLLEDGIDGVLVGAASLDIKEFLAIC
ncbi:MAG: triose-phosphate isomerase [Candidatus Pacebacteria bacterium]|nr:triose-phosphate isomerase [Candidatus Paceibacterota bacterium]